MIFTTTISLRAVATASPQTTLLQELPEPLDLTGSVRSSLSSLHFLHRVKTPGQLCSSTTP
jgi:hypothetical protein